MIRCFALFGWGHGVGKRLRACALSLAGDSEFILTKGDR